MQTHFGTDLAAIEWQASVVCIGTFDGVHLGHEELIRQAVSVATESERPSVLVTFDRHPVATLAPGKEPPSVATLEQNLRQFRRLGVACCAVLAFDERLAAMEASEFLHKILEGHLKATELVVGHDFAMGHDRVGTADWLRERIPTQVVPKVELDGTRIASSVVRRSILSGDVDGVARLLGRPFALAGVVIGGEKLGRRLGFPTANLGRSTNQAVPADGVYAGHCDTPAGRCKAAISIGMRPTVRGTSRVVEAYLLDYPGDSLYGLPLEFEFSKRLRGQITFNGVDELIDQMKVDVAEVAALDE